MAAMNAPDQAGNYFQTDTSLAEEDRKHQKAANTFGNPIEFPSKILAIGVNQYFDPTGDVVFVAEAAGSISGIRLSTNELSTAPRGPQAPLTSLAFNATPATSVATSTTEVFAGCWDKSIWRYSFKGNNVVHQTSFPAHVDFVKCLVIAPTPDKQQVIISGGTDGDIRFWNLDGHSLGAIKPGIRGIECLVIDPLSPPAAPVIFASSSKQEIISFTLPSLFEISAHKFQLTPPIVAHATSVYKLHFDDDGDLWSASADKTAKHLLRAEGWRVETTLIHPDFVRDVVTHGKYGWVITACRDENVRVWSTATGDIYHVFTGHYEEVTGLALVRDFVLSVSIDATLRRWNLAPGELRKAVEEAKTVKLIEQVPEPQIDLGMLTEEEEAELRAMMESEEEQALQKMALDEQ